MESVMDKQIVLVLNTNWQGIDQVTVRKAVEDMTSISVYGEAPKLGMDIPDDENGVPWPTPWDEWIRLPVRPHDLSIQCARYKIRCPTVVVCQTYSKVPVISPNLVASAIFERDQCTCQYCGKAFPKKQLNIDHVIPDSRGGPRTWTNLVTSCIKCNTLKADRTPAEARMKLIRKPVAPKVRPRTFGFTVAKHPTWERFLHI